MAVGLGGQIGPLPRTRDSAVGKLKTLYQSNITVVRQATSREPAAMHQRVYQECMKAITYIFQSFSGQITIRK